MNKKTPLRFPITVFSVEKISDTLSKARARIFYRKANRNGSYITDEFAEDLILTLPYTPIKGIFNEETDDFEGHGKVNHLGKIYGVVPETPNVTWEPHEDSDGVIRTYATTDIILYTALYEEAGDIVGKAQSMELYPPSIEGDWTTINGQLFFKYTKASFLGLQVLGDDVTPAFEGAKFFSEKEVEGYEILLNLFNKFEDLSIGRSKEMEYNPTFALSDDQKRDKLFQALNPEEVTYWIMEVYDTHLIAYDYEAGKTFKIKYMKDDETDSVTVSDEKVEVFTEFITQGEKDSLAALRAAAAVSTFEEINTVFNDKVQEIKNVEQTLTEKEEENATLFTAKETVETELKEVQETVVTLNETIEQFEALKTEIKEKEMNAVFAKYEGQLKPEILEIYKEKVADFSVLELEKDLAYELVQSKALFSANNGDDGLEGYMPLPSGDSGLSALIKKHN